MAATAAVCEFPKTAPWARLAVMEEIAELARQIDREKIARARETSIEEKLLDGPRLFSVACEAMKSGIRVLHPGASDDDIAKALWERNYGAPR